MCVCRNLTSICAFKLITFSRQSSVFVYGWQASLSFFFPPKVVETFKHSKKKSMWLINFCVAIVAEIPGPSKLSRRCYLIAKCNQKSISSLAVVTYNRDRIMLILFLMLITRIIILVIKAHYTLDIPTIIAFLTSSSWKKPCTFFYVVRVQNLWWHLIWMHYMTRFDLQDN